MKDLVTIIYLKPTDFSLQNFNLEYSLSAVIAIRFLILNKIIWPSSAIILLTLPSTGYTNPMTNMDQATLCSIGIFPTVAHAVLIMDNAGMQPLGILDFILKLYTPS